MNPKPVSETDAIRSDIDMTRRRMDETINALGQRLHGRHLLDEIIGFFRSDDDSEGAVDRVREKMADAGGQIKEKVSAAASTASRAVVNTIKENPVPVALIGAGVAWLAYSALSRKRHGATDAEPWENEAIDPDNQYDQPLEYPSAATDEFDANEEDGAEGGLGEFNETVADKTSAATDAIKDEASDLTDRASESFSSLKERASTIGNHVKERSRELYQEGRERVVRTVDEHPLEIGLGCLAVGVLLGLALPTPKPVHRVAGRTVDRLRNRTRRSSRDLLQKGKRVARAAADAARNEAQAQGLTLENLRRSGRSAANRAESAVGDAGGTEGMASPNDVKTPAPPADPSMLGPAM